YPIENEKRSADCSLILLISSSNIFACSVVLDAHIISTPPFDKKNSARSIAAMNDKYFGGGMKIAPKESRTSDNLNLVIVKTANKFMLFLIFSMIYLGLH